MSELDNLLEKAEDAKEKNDRKKSTKYLINALKIANDPKDIAFIYLKIGSNLHVLEKNKEARKFLYLALDNIKNYTDEESKGSIGWIYFLISSTYYIEDDHKNGLAFGLKSTGYLKYLCDEEKYSIFRLIGSYYFFAEDYQKAIDYFRKAQKLTEIADEDKALAFFYQGRCYQYQRKYEKAINYYNKALTFSCIPDEDKTTIYTSLGQCYEEKDELKKAFESFRSGFSIESVYESDWELVYSYGYVAYNIKQYHTAIECFELVKKQIPKKEIDLIEYIGYSLGNSYLWQRNYKSALREYNNAFKLKTGSSNRKGAILSGIASVYFGSGNLKRAIKYSLEAMNYTLDRGVSEVLYYMLAYSYLTIGDEPKGKFYLDKLKEVDKRSAYLREVIEKWEDKLGDDYKKLLAGP